MAASVLPCDQAPVPVTPSSVACGEQQVPADAFFRNGLKEILQSKTMTSAAYRMSSTQMDLLAYLKLGLQSYLTKSCAPGDVPSSIVLPLSVNFFPNYKRNKRKFCIDIEKLVGVKVYFWWRYDRSKNTLNEFIASFGYRKNICGYKDGELVCSPTTIVSNADIGTESGTALVEISRKAFPFLLYFGQGVGGTVFNLETFLSLANPSSKRVYELLCDWSTCCSVKKVPISELKRIFLLSDSYSNADLKRKILDKAKDEINGSGSSVKFDYELKYDPAFGISKEKKKKANVAVFTLQRQAVQHVDPVKVLVIMLRDICDKELSPLCGEVAEKLVAEGKDVFIRSKFSYYDKKRRSGGMTAAKYRNTMLKIVREMSGIDLRSQRHIRNSLKYSEIRTGGVKSLAEGMDLSLE